jgi:hypothetical protein
MFEHYWRFWKNGRSFFQKERSIIGGHPFSFKGAPRRPLYRLYYIVPFFISVNVIFIFFSFERLARDRDRSSHVLSLFLFFFRV